MYFKQISTPGLGCYSYMLGCPLAGVAAVVDPRRDIGIYLEQARQNNMTITHVFETHVHADHISGAQELRRATGASICMYKDSPVSFPIHGVADGDIVIFGAVHIKILHTPGHTPHSISLLVSNTIRSAEPALILTGDTLFVGTVGRPDLPSHEIMDAQVESLYNSLYHKLAPLPDGLEVYPAHGQGSLCGRGISDKSNSTLGYERIANPMLTCSSFQEFKEKVLQNLPMRPQSFSHIIATNLAGAPLLENTQYKEYALDTKAFAKAIDRGAVVIDIRDVTAYAGAHIPDSLNISTEDTKLTNWLGTIVPPNTPLLLVLKSDNDFTDVVTDLQRIGYDSFLGYLKGGIRSWISAGQQFVSLPLITAKELKERMHSDTPPTLLDVRGKAEFEEFHIDGAVQYSFDYLLDRKSCPDLPNDLVIVCLSGYRSNVAASIFQARHCKRVQVLAGGLMAWKTQNMIP